MPPVYQLRTPKEIEEEFLGALDRVRRSERLDALLEVLKPLLQDPSFLKIGLTQMFAKRDRRARSFVHVSDA